MKELTDDSFEDAVKEGIVLVDFWAEWCAPCRMIAPIVEELAGEYEGKVVFAKMDVSANKEVPGKYGISAIPTLIVFKDGKQADSVVGAVSKEKIKAMIDGQL